MTEQVFYRCNVCGNLITMIENTGAIPSCCGQPMEKLEAGKADASQEKHVPIVERVENKLTVTVGEIPHPMSELHFIEWICVQTNRGFHVRRLYPGCRPGVRIRLCSSEWVICVYAYCNLHGLWQACKT